MLFLILHILSTVTLMIIFKLYGKFKINVLQAITTNYLVCIVTGFFLLPKDTNFSIHFNNGIPDWVFAAALMGTVFIVVFTFVARVTPISGVAITTVATKLSMIIPILLSLFLFETAIKNYDFVNVLGFLVVFISVFLTSWKDDFSMKHDSKSLKSFFVPVMLLLSTGISDTIFNYFNLMFINTVEKEILFSIFIFISGFIIGSIIISYNVLKGIVKIEWKNIVGGVILGVPNYFSVYLLMKTLGSFNNDGAFVFPIVNMGIIITSALFAILFFKEKMLKINIIGLILAILGLFLLSYQELMNA